MLIKELFLRCLRYLSYTMTNLCSYLVFLRILEKFYKRKALFPLLHLLHLLFLKMTPSKVIFHIPPMIQRPSYLTLLYILFKQNAPLDLHENEAENTIYLQEKQSNSVIGFTLYLYCFYFFPYSYILNFPVHIFTLVIWNAVGNQHTLARFVFECITEWKYLF